MSVCVACVTIRLRAKKRWAAKPTSRCGSGPQMKVLAAPSIARSPLHEECYRTVVHELNGHARTEATALCTERIAYPLIQRLRLLRRRGVDEARAVSLARVA